MLNIMENIDPINYIVQDVLTRIDGYSLEPKNNFYIADGYSLDVTEGRKNHYKLKVRTSTLQDLCNISMDKNTLVVRFSPELFFYSNKKDGWYSSSLFEETFAIQELPEVLERNNTMYGYGVEFDAMNMVQTLELCRRVHSEFIRKISV